MKLLEAAVGGEDGKPAKMLVPKAIDADDADSGSEDDSDDDDDESVSVPPTCIVEVQEESFYVSTSARSAHISVDIQVSSENASNSPVDFQLSQVQLPVGQIGPLAMLKWQHPCLSPARTDCLPSPPGRRGAAAGGTGAHQAGACGGGGQSRR